MREDSPHRKLANPAKAAYHRNLPHFQVEERPLFVTFRTYQGWTLPDSARALVMQHCLHDHNRKIRVYAAVVMPDHVHLLFQALTDAQGNTYGLAEIMSGIKGASAHRINKALGRTGHVWQDESFDHVLRCDEGLNQKAEYICQNPVRKGLVRSPDEYPWMWRSWLEGAVDNR